MRSKPIAEPIRDGRSDPVEFLEGASRESQRHLPESVGAFDAVPLATLRAVAPRTILDRVAKRAWSSRMSILVRCDLPTRDETPSGNPGLAISFVDPRECSPLPSMLPNARDGDALFLAALERTRSEAAGELVLAYEAGQLAAVHFIHTAQHQDRLARVAPNLYPVLMGGEALTESLFVFPAFRSRGIAGTILRASTRELSRRGYRRALAMIDVENHRSLGAFRAAGFTAQPAYRIDSYRLGRRTSRLVDFG
jgi:GNAT superfamily N-acetyltransferase